MCQEFSWTNINKTINIPAEKSGSISHYKKYVMYFCYRPILMNTKFLSV